MSGGEQSIFPILYEFVQKQIAYSVVLIDEIDMHLHPPYAQFLVTQLPKICSTCHIMSGQTPQIKTPETLVITALQLWAIVKT